MSAPTPSPSPLYASIISAAARRRCSHASWRRIQRSPTSRSADRPARRHRVIATRPSARDRMLNSGHRRERERGQLVARRQRLARVRLARGLHHLLVVLYGIAPSSTTLATARARSNRRGVRCCSATVVLCGVPRGVPPLAQRRADGDRRRRLGARRDRRRRVGRRDRRGDGRRQADRDRALRAPAARRRGAPPTVGVVGGGSIAVSAIRRAPSCGAPATRSSPTAASPPDARASTSG